MGDRHVVSDVNKQILYIDANNLYGWAQNQYLATGNFEKLFFPNNYSQEQVVEDFLQIPADNENGIFIEFSQDIKQTTKNFPLCLDQYKLIVSCFKLYEFWKTIEIQTKPEACM